MDLNIYDYLYYCFYKLFKLIKRKVNIDHLLASSFFAVIISFNILTLLMITGILGVVYNKIGLGVLIMGIFIADYFLHQYYFIKSQRYAAIIKHYDQDPKIKKGTCVGLAIFITIASFFLFWFVGLLINNSNHPS